MNDTLTQAQHQSAAKYIRKGWIIIHQYPNGVIVLSSPGRVGGALGTGLPGPLFYTGSRKVSKDTAQILPDGWVVVSDSRWLGWVLIVFGIATIFTATGAPLGLILCPIGAGVVWLNKGQLEEQRTRFNKLEESLR